MHTIFECKTIEHDWFDAGLGIDNISLDKVVMKIISDVKEKDNDLNRTFLVFYTDEIPFEEGLADIFKRYLSGLSGENSIDIVCNNAEDYCIIIIRKVCGALTDYAIDSYKKLKTLDIELMKKIPHGSETSVESVFFIFPYLEDDKQIIPVKILYDLALLYSKEFFAYRYQPADKVEFRKANKNIKEKFKSHGIDIYESLSNILENPQYLDVFKEFLLKIENHDRNEPRNENFIEERE